MSDCVDTVFLCKISPCCIDCILGNGTSETLNAFEAIDSSKLFSSAIIADMIRVLRIKMVLKSEGAINLESREFRYTIAYSILIQDILSSAFTIKAKFQCKVKRIQIEDATNRDMPIVFL